MLSRGVLVELVSLSLAVSKGGREGGREGEARGKLERKEGEEGGRLS